jgi:hypothetical protein
MKRTDWVELKQLRNSTESWYKRRVYRKPNETMKCSSCGKQKAVTSALFEYVKVTHSSSEAHCGISSGDATAHWNGNSYCNANCLPDSILASYRLANRRHHDPSAPERIKLRKQAVQVRVKEFVARYEELGKSRGSVTTISKEMGLSRQRVHQILEKWYGTGNVGAKPNSQTT